MIVRGDVGYCTADSTRKKTTSGSKVDGLGMAVAEFVRCALGVWWDVCIYSICSVRKV